ncbi:carbon-nitrogen hydrolase family protein [Fodinicurvata fenggangensis]|uniref:carbon-nitrogen hydrolase family protein n=1 Tax=Fodinicurvata fenggangensis TaxID=1121830 RepID=UPI00047C45D6|nr:carbon-nitrogen hydrolase family protein [Fodinicurvata fenggangensis]
MKVTVCELDPREEHLEDGLAQLAAHIEREQSDFLLLPELCFSPWLAADKDASESRWLASVEAHRHQISSLSRLNAKAALGTRPIVTAQGSRRNEAYVWNQETDSAVGIREKYYLPDEEGYWEHHWYDRGPRRFDLARALGMRIGVQICTEMWFFEWARHYAASRADILCIPRVTPHGSTEKWLAGGQAAAVCAGAYSLSSNLWCPPGDKANCGGLGWVIDPEGNVLTRTSRETPFATAEIDLDFARHSKATYPRYVPE